MTPMGFEPMQNPRENQGVTKSSDAESDALGDDRDALTAWRIQSDPNLAQVVAAWPELPQAIRAGIVVLASVGLPPAPKGGLLGGARTKAQ